MRRQKRVTETEVENKEGLEKEETGQKQGRQEHQINANYIYYVRSPDVHVEGRATLDDGNEIVYWSLDPWNRKPRDEGTALKALFQQHPPTWELWAFLQEIGNSPVDTKYEEIDPILFPWKTGERIETTMYLQYLALHFQTLER